MTAGVWPSPRSSRGASTCAGWRPTARRLPNPCSRRTRTSDWRWAPDGASGVFKVWSPVSETDIWRARGDGSEPTPLVASALEDSDPTFSPDGKWLAYQSGGSLYVAPYPSLAPRVVVVQAAERPRWSRSATELFYVEEGRLKALAYEVRAGAFRPAAATTLFELGRLSTIFDVAPDGRRFLFLARPPESPDRDVIRVVLNGFEELRGGAPVQGRTPEREVSNAGGGLVRVHRSVTA